jgi:pimeloyl-ACP methyl ester carboxylesterase
MIQALEIRDYWVIGHSLGGMIALQFCEYYFQEIEGAVVIGTTSHFPAKLSIWRNLGTFFISRTLRQVWQRALKSIRIEHQRSLIQDLLNNIDSVPLYVSAANRLSVVNFRLNLKSITCPILIIVGENDDLTPVRLSEKLHEKLPRSELAIIPDTGHMAFIEKPEEINEIMAQFFQRR